MTKTQHLSICYYNLLILKFNYRTT